MFWTGHGNLSEGLFPQNHRANQVGNWTRKREEKPSRSFDKLKVKLIGFAIRPGLSEGCQAGGTSDKRKESDTARHSE